MENNGVFGPSIYINDDNSELVARTDMGECKIRVSDNWYGGKTHLLPEVLRSPVRFISDNDNFLNEISKHTHNFKITQIYNGRITQDDYNEMSFVPDSLGNEGEIINYSDAFHYFVIGGMSNGRWKVFVCESCNMMNILSNLINSSVSFEKSINKITPFQI